MCAFCVFKFSKAIYEKKIGTSYVERTRKIELIFRQIRLKINSLSTHKNRKKSIFV